MAHTGVDNEEIILNFPDPPSSPRMKHKRKKNRENDEPFKEHSTKKKKKSPQQKTKKKKHKKQQSKSPNASNKGNYHKKKKKKNNKNEHKKRKNKNYRKHGKRIQYQLGSVLVLPQNKNIWGWVHCKYDNMMYRLAHSQKTSAFQVNEKILFLARKRKNGLSSIRNIDKVNILSLHDIHREYLNHKNESIASNDTFVLNTPLNRNETNDTEFKMYSSVGYNKKFKQNLIKTIEKYLNGFINMNGGTIYIGISDEATVKGIDFMSRKEFDLMQQLLPQRLNKWQPQKYTRDILKSLKFEMKDIINIDHKENCGFILPKCKVMEASISSIYDDVTKEQVICRSSDSFVYCREGTSLTVYSDATMTADHKCAKKPLNANGYNYGFWDPVSKNANRLNLMSFDEGDDVLTADEKTQSQSSSSNDDEDEESDSLVYMDSTHSNSSSDEEDQDLDSDSVDVDSDEDEDSEHKKNMKYVRKPSTELNDTIINDLLALHNDDFNENRRKSYHAVFDYNGGKLANELLFKRDDEIIVDDSKNNGLYLYGYKQNSPNDKGWFPNSYVREMQ